jgi:hypothetical protein
MQPVRRERSCCSRLIGTQTGSFEPQLSLKPLSTAVFQPGPDNEASTSAPQSPLKASAALVSG